ncbi:MAG: large subunit ribosomal protein [Patescibacteria group bacterium]|nr:large subunit ribosomal protein [Patescibacteria group bacterium]
MATFTLTAKTRQIFGKKNKILRKQEIVPAVVYGRKTQPLSLEIKLKDFLPIYHKAGETDLIDLIIEDEEGKKITKKVLVQEVNRDYINNKPLHLDFYEVEMDKPVTTHVPLIFVGEPPAVKLGGILVKSMDELEIEALPKDLPHALEVDVSSLDSFDKSVYVRDVKLPPGVKSLVKEDTPIATINAPLTEEELEEELGKVKTVAEVEVEGEKKEEKEEGEGAAPTEEKEENKEVKSES